MSVLPIDPSGSAFPHSLQASAGEGAPRPSQAGGARSEATPRLVIRGETSRTTATIDWLAFTVDAYSKWSFDDVPRFLNHAFDNDIVSLVKRDRGIYGFDDSWFITFTSVGESLPVGLVASGGTSQRGKMMISMSGVACARVLDWQFVHDRLESTDATITRVDLAHDDLEGKKTVHDILREYHDGAFNSGGRKPKCKPAGDWINDNGDGRTLYIGNRLSGKFCRVYEKGRQLGDRTSPWVRTEVEFRKKDRYLPHDIVTDPAKYLAGCYPALQFVSDTSTRIKTNRKAAQVTLESLIRNASIACGKTINAMTEQGLDSKAIVARLVRPGLPKRLIGPSAAMEKGVLYAFGDDEND